MESRTGLMLMTMMAKVMPEEELLKKLQEALTEYKVIKTKKTKRNLEFYLMLASTNMLTTEKPMMEVMNDVERSHAAISLLDDKTKTTS